MAKTNYRCLLAIVLYFFAVCSVSSSSLVNKFAAPRQCHVYKKPGDLILGGMFAITENYPSTCNYTTDEIQFTMLLPEAMAFAIYDVNRRSDLLPNITLGFEIWDHGVSEDAAVGISMSLLQEPPRGPSKTCDLAERKKLVGIVGPESSAMSVFVSKIAQTYRVPVVSHWATSNELSNKARFPYFMRSVPPDQLQAGAIVELLLNFGWDYIAVIYTVDSYGIHGAREIVSQAERKNICIAMSAPLSELHTERDMLEVALRIKRLDSVRIVVMFSSTGPIAYTFLSQILKVGLPYRITWIGSDGWGYELLQNDLLKELVEGSIFVRLNSPKQPEFERYLNTIDPRMDATSEWFTYYWRDRLAHNCTDTDALASCVVPLPDGFSTEYNTAGAIDAVNVFAYALHSLWIETCPSGSANCTLEAAQIDGDNFLKHLRNVTFTSSTGPFTLNENGDTEGIYLFENLQYVDGKHRFRDVGQWNSRMGNGERLQLFQDELQWSGLNSSQEVPRSTCRKICSAGQISVPLKEKCCWGCESCAPNAIIFNGTECMECARTFWPNAAFDRCVAIVPYTVSLGVPIATGIFAMLCVGILMTCLTAAGLVYYRHNRLVKASSRELSVVNLLGLTATFIAVIPLLQPPSDLTCSMSEALISLCFTLTYAPTLFKVNRIYRIFSAGKRSVRRPRFVQPRHQLAMTGTLIVIQLVAVVLVSLSRPARPSFLFTSPPSDHVELYCVFSPAFPGLCAYNLLIILLCCYFAFRARKVPDNYNESKFIGVSVYSSLMLWLAAVPVYTTAVEATQKVAFLSLAIVANSFLTLFCVYFPKLFAIRFLGNARVSDMDDSINLTTKQTIKIRPGLSTVII